MRIVRLGPSFFSPIIGRIPLKSVNSFIFVRSRWCKNSTPAFPLAYKSTYTHHDSSVKNTDIIRSVLVNACANSSSRRLFLLFLAFGLIHFLTLINNSSTISQRANLKNLHLFVSVVSLASSVLLGAKLVPLYLSTKII